MPLSSWSEPREPRGSWSPCGSSPCRRCCSPPLEPLHGVCAEGRWNGVTRVRTPDARVLVQVPAPGVRHGCFDTFRRVDERAPHRIGCIGPWRCDQSRGLLALRRQAQRPGHRRERQRHVLHHLLPPEGSRTGGPRGRSSRGSLSSTEEETREGLGACAGREPTGSSLISWSRTHSRPCDLLGLSVSCSPRPQVVHVRLPASMRGPSWVGAPSTSKWIVKAGTTWR